MKTLSQHLFQNLVLISLVALGLISGAAVYGIHILWSSVDQYRSDALPKQSFATATLDIGINFKLQVQEWKNVLLRSVDTTSFQNQTDKLIKQEVVVQNKFNELILATNNSPLRQQLLSAKDTHLALGKHYRHAMLIFQDNGFDFLDADRQIMGKDRPLDQLLHELSNQAIVQAKQAQVEADAAAQHALTISIAGLVLGIFFAVISFYYTLKHKVLQPTERVFADLKTATELLLQSERMAGLSQLVAGVAHEINTPVGITLTCATNMQEMTQKISDQLQSGSIRKQELTAFIAQTTEGCALITSNAYRTANLVKSFKQIATDQSSEQRREFSFAIFFDEVLLSLTPEFKHTHLQIIPQCNDVIVLDSYPGALGQVLTNLLLNAKHHAFLEDQHGMITINAKRVDAFIEIDVADNGCGISKDILPKVFDPFFTTNRHAGGTGLGLNIVYNLVTETLGGEIRILSEVGQGTQFLIRIPQHAPDEKTPNMA